MLNIFIYMTFSLFQKKITYDSWNTTDGIFNDTSGYFSKVDMRIVLEH